MRLGLLGVMLRRLKDTNGDGVANDIPPEAQAAVEDGAFA
jgi:hypothetical protein